jgi:hypothetical protein
MSNLLRTVTLDSARRRKDKSVSLTFITSTEQTSNQFIEIDKLLDSSGVVFFKDSENISEEEISSLEATKIDVKVKGKSDSQLLRNVLYRLWEQTPINIESNNSGIVATKLKFDAYYTNEMKRIIQHFKDKLD